MHETNGYTGLLPPVRFASLIVSRMVVLKLANVISLMTPCMSDGTLPSGGLSCFVAAGGSMTGINGRGGVHDGPAPLVVVAVWVVRARGMS